MHIQILVNKCILGEFGVVYKAMLGPKGTFSREVAVKTLKGWSRINILM